MSIRKTGRKALEKLYRFNAVKNFKDDVAVPMRHAIMGKRGFYEALDIVKSLTPDIKTVFDFGASIGEKAYVLAKEFPNATIYCFEPIPASFEHLKKRVAKYGARVKCFNFGFAGENGTREFHTYNTGDPMSMGISSLLPFEERPMQPNDPQFRSKITVTVRKLDDVFKELGLTSIDFMKVDVEGVEGEIFKSGGEALQHTKNLFVEILPNLRGIHNRDYLDVLELLYRSGFSLEGIHEDFLFTRMLK